MIKRSILIMFFLFCLFSNSIFIQSEETIAVLPFDAMGVSKEDTFGFTLLFETALQDTHRFIVIEQVDLGKILKAQEHALSDYTDDDNTLSIGKLLSAKYIVGGAVGKVGDQFYINLKIINIESGKHFNSLKKTGSKLISLLESIDTLAWELTGAKKVDSDDTPIGKVLLSKQSTYRSLGGLLNYYLYSYDSKGLLNARFRFDKESKLDAYYLYEYDDGREVKSTEYDLKGKIVRYYTYQYNDNGLKISGEMLDSKGNRERKFTYEYNSDNQLTKQSYRNLNGSLFSYYTFIYDEEGRELMRTYYDAWKKPLSYMKSEYLVVTISD